MKISDYLKCLILLSIFLFISCQTCCPPPIKGDARCDNITEKGFINILDINVLALEPEDMDKRFEYIADFAAENEVDVILLQEIIGGLVTGTNNSAQDLREILRNKHNLDYNISTAWEIGDPDFWSSANAILSRCEIKYSRCESLPFVEKLWKRDKDKKMKAISITRNVQIVRLEIPERGEINVYNTHVCARCEIDGRDKQLEKLLEFVISMDTEMPGNYPSVLGGDFNFDRFDNEGAEKFLWEKIINNGFIDAYAAFIIANSSGYETLETLCEHEDNADEHCTVGVSQLNGPNARRVDYIFTKSPATIRAARVAFNELVNDDEPTVSDHAGVFISLELP
jgi:maltose 6'-phosphate phosphatase